MNLDYTYDENGNMKFDGGRDISLSYNPTINLPNEVDFGSNNRIFYYYTAGGAKLLKHVAPSSGSDTYTTYVGNFVYEDGKLAYILTSEGRLIPNGTGTDRKFLYEYTLKDHLGNSRVTFMGTDLGNAIDVVQTNSYYPFGLSLLQNNGNTSGTYKKNKYLYNGKEIQDDFLNSKFFGMLDYGARFYDAQIGRWHSVDPSCEEEGQESWTPYHYVLNNPIRNTDPDGRLFVIDNLIGAAVGAAVDYGTQVATNYISGNEDPWTDNINVSSIAVSATAGFITSGASTIVKATTNIAASVIKNTVQVKTSADGLQVNVEKNVINVAKNTAIDLAVNKVAGKIGGTAETKITKAGLTNAGKLSSTTKAIVKATGNNVTRATTATVKKGIETAAKVAKTTTTSIVKAVTNDEKAKIKAKTNL